MEGKIPIYEWACDCGHRETVCASIKDRDGFKPEHDCGRQMSRQVGGRGLLYYEEGRARMDQGLGGAPITSHADHARRMRQAGVTEAGDAVPAAIRANPKSMAMQRYLASDKKGRWI